MIFRGEKKKAELNDAQIGHKKFWEKSEVRDVKTSRLYLAIVREKKVQTERYFCNFDKKRQHCLIKSNNWLLLLFFILW